MATVVISPYDVANYPQGGGHFWVYLQYVLGLRLLGHDVYWLEAFRSKGREELEAAALATFQARMEQYGLRGKCVLYRTQRSEEHTSELQSHSDLVCRLLLEKKKTLRAPSRLDTREPSTA